MHHKKPYLFQKAAKNRCRVKSLQPSFHKVACAQIYEMKAHVEKYPLCFQAAKCMTVALFFSPAVNEMESLTRQQNEKKEEGGEARAAPGCRAVSGSQPALLESVHQSLLDPRGPNNLPPSMSDAPLFTI